MFLQPLAITRFCPLEPHAERRQSVRPLETSTPKWFRLRIPLLSGGCRIEESHGAHLPQQKKHRGLTSAQGEFCCLRGAEMKKLPGNTGQLKLGRRKTKAGSTRRCPSQGLGCVAGRSLHPLLGLEPALRNPNSIADTLRMLPPSAPAQCSRPVLPPSAPAQCSRPVLPPASAKAPSCSPERNLTCAELVLHEEALRRAAGFHALGVLGLRGA